jgi:hypothetical protein
MQPSQPFKFAEEKMLFSKPICWTTKPKTLSRILGFPVETIEEIQRTHLYQSLLNSAPVRPLFLEEYEQELIKTANYQRNLEKIPIYKDEMKPGTNVFTVELDASFITDKVNEHAKNRDKAPNKEEERL